MRVVEHSSASVETALSDLETAYGPFPVNQTTVSVSPERYERARGAVGGDWIDLYAMVRNGDEGVLHVDATGGRVLPGVSVGDGDSLEPNLREKVRGSAGVECRIGEVAEARIVGIRDRSRDDCETVYRLAVVFEAEHRAGSAGERAVWLDDIRGLPVQADERA